MSLEPASPRSSCPYYQTLTPLSFNSVITHISDSLVPILWEMAEPFSTASAAAGLISLGLQVCSGLAKYYQAWKSCSHDLDQIHHRLSQLSRVFDILESILPGIDPSAEELVDDITRIIEPCRAILLRLKDIHSKCQKAAPNSTFGQQVQYHGLRTLYPFRRETLRSVGNDLTDLLANLNTALHVLQLSVTMFCPLFSLLTCETRTGSEAQNQQLSKLKALLLSIDVETKATSVKLGDIEGKIIETSVATNSTLVRLQRGQDEFKPLLASFHDETSTRLERAILSRIDDHGQQLSSLKEMEQADHKSKDTRLEELASFSPPFFGSDYTFVKQVVNTCAGKNSCKYSASPDTKT